MSLFARILGHSSVSLWGLDSETRLERILQSFGAQKLPDDASALAPDTPVLLVNAAYLFETRTLKLLSSRTATLLRCTEDGGHAAIATTLANAAGLADVLLDPDAPLPDGLTVIDRSGLGDFDVALRRSEPPLLRLLAGDDPRELENLLYANSYKGITDLVTKWLWPRPAKRLVHVCTRYSITPNMVTALSFVLVLAATWLFAEGAFWLGLAAGWLMTLLDTVDGKLARVTVRSSRFGHYFDHLIDLIHPPFWYICWAEAVTLPEQLSPYLDRPQLYALIIGGYIAGRIVEGLFHLFASCSVFSWRPADAWFRLITARRNPCLIQLTGAQMLDEPAWGIVIVALWTVLTSAVLLLRLIQAAITRAFNAGPLESWLSATDAPQTYPLSYRTFSATRGAHVRV